MTLSIRHSDFLMDCLALAIKRAGLPLFGSPAISLEIRGFAPAIAVHPTSQGYTCLLLRFGAGTHLTMGVPFSYRYNDHALKVYVKVYRLALSTSRSGNLREGHNVYKFFSNIKHRREFHRRETPDEEKTPDQLVGEPWIRLDNSGALESHLPELPDERRF